MNTHFLYFSLSRAGTCFFYAGMYSTRNALPYFCSIMLRQRRFRNVNIAHETVMNHRNHMIKTLSVLLGVSGIKMSLMVGQTFQDILNWFRSVIPLKAFPSRKKPILFITILKFGEWENILYGVPTVKKLSFFRKPPNETSICCTL